MLGNIRESIRPKSNAETQRLKFMEFGITCDIYWETRVDDFLDITNDKKNSIVDYFNKKYFGEKPKGIFIVLMCRQPYLKFKQRKRYSKKDNILYLDIMLNYDEMINSEKTKRNEIIATNIISELPIVLEKYKFSGFDLELFKKDLVKYFVEKKVITLPNTVYKTLLVQ